MLLLRLVALHILLIMLARTRLCTHHIGLAFVDDDTRSVHNSQMILYTLSVTTTLALCDTSILCMNELASGSEIMNLGMNITVA